MRSTLSGPTGFAISLGIALVCVMVAGVMVAAASSAPAFASDVFAFSVPRGWFDVASGAGAVMLAIRVRRLHQAAGYVLLGVACSLAGWAIEAVGYDAAENRIVLHELLAGLALVPAVCAITVAYIAASPRRVGRRGTVALGSIVALSVVAVIGQTVVLEGGSFYPSLSQSIVDWFASPVVTLALVSVALGRSLVGDARRHVLAARAVGRRAAVPRLLRSFMVVAALVGTVAIVAGAVQLVGATRGETLLPMLAVLVGVIAARWSAAVAWSAVAVSLAIGGSVLFANALDVEVQSIVADPEHRWTPTITWLLFAGSSIAIAVLALAAAALALLEAGRTASIGDDDADPRPSLLIAGATGIAAWATASWLVGDDDLLPLLEGPVWAMAMAITVVGGVLALASAVALRARLVPAIAEAEATARRPLQPFRYLETVAIELLTARSAVQRSAVAAERSRLASDLHAQILPSLADIRSRYESGAPDADVAVRLRDLEREVRDLMAERRLVLLEEFGIVEAIEWLVGRAEERTAMEVQLSVDDRSTSTRPPREVERAAFRIAQLAVENALQHASPSRLELQVLARSDEVRVAVVDDGLGLRVPIDRDRDHLGISDMRTQAAEVRGDVTVSSPTSGGTMVTFAWPAA